MVMNVMGMPMVVEVGVLLCSMYSASGGKTNRSGSCV